jgi:hypothetical protein
LYRLLWHSCSCWKDHTLGWDHSIISCFSIIVKCNRILSHQLNNIVGCSLEENTTDGQWSIDAPHQYSGNGRLGTN